MKRTVLPVVILMAISIITMGTVINASSKAKDQTNGITNSLADQSTGASGTIQPKPEADLTVVTVQLTPNGGENKNWRHPGVAEDSKGNRLVIFRGPEGNQYYYVYCPKDGTWSAPQSINGGVQPALIGSLYAYIEIDSSDNFHCYWENANSAVYASFRNGVWTTPMKQEQAGRYDQTSGMTVRSTDEVVTVDCEVQGGFSKEVFLHRKGKNDSEFGEPFNLTRDEASGSTQPHVAVDSKDHVFVVWKSDFKIEDVDENLVIYLSEFDTDSKDVNDWMFVSPNPGWSFLPQVAVNSEDKVMTLCATSTWGDYVSTFYNPATKTLSKLIPLRVGLVMAPWHTFFSRMVSHGKDFYAAVLNPARTLVLMKFNETTSSWDRIATVSDRGVEQFALYSGYDKMLIAWNSNEEPTSVFFSTVGVDPFSKSRVKSVSNLVVEKRVERGFFRGYTLNTLTWEANPDNALKGITITAHRIYRKTRTEDNTKWTLITEVAGTVFKYEDRNIPANSDFVYAVTCVDDKEHESKVY